MRSVIFLPGIIAPAAIRYQPLLACLPDVQACPKDLEVYESDAPPADYSIDMEVRALDRTADAAGFERFHLYGHSGGGAVALAYATGRAERLLSLALDEPAYDFTPEARAELETFRPVAALPASERMREFMKLQVSSLVELPPPAGPPPPWMARRPGGVAAFLDALERHDLLAHRYASVRVPT